MYKWHIRHPLTNRAATAMFRQEEIEESGSVAHLCRAGTLEQASPQKVRGKGREDNWSPGERGEWKRQRGKERRESAFSREECKRRVKCRWE